MNSQKEIYQALLDGEPFCEEGWGRHEYVLLGDHGHLVDENGDITHQSFDYPSKWSIYKAPAWHDSIPEGGVLCWVDDQDPDRKYRIEPVLVHDEERDFPFRTEHTGFTYATPIPKSQIQKWLLNAPGE